MSSTLHHLAGRLFLSNKNQLPKLFTFNHNLSSERKQAADSQKTLWVFLSPLFDMKKKKNDVIASQSEKWLMKRTKIAYHNRSFRVFDRAQKSFPFYSHSFWFQSRKRKKKLCKQYFNVAKWIFRHNSLSVMYFIIKSEIECRILDAPTRRWYLFVTNFTSELPSDSSSIHRWRYRFSAASSSDSPFNSQLFNYTNNVNTAF